MTITKWMRKKTMNRLVKIENLNISKRERRIKRTMRWAIIATLAWIVPFTTEIPEKKWVFENVYAGVREMPENVSSPETGTAEDGAGVEGGNTGEDVVAKIAKTFPENPDVMVAIAKAESGLNPKATNVNRNGSSDIGLFQVNSIHGYDDLEMFAPEKNIEAARKIYEKQGLTAWVVFQTGAYKKFL